MYPRSSRLEKAIDLINADAISKADNIYTVKSGEREYQVIVGEDSYACNCEWGTHVVPTVFDALCSHAWAVAGFIAREDPLV